MNWIKTWWMIYLPLTALVAALVIVALSGQGVLPFDFDTARGYLAIGIVGFACLTIEFIGYKRMPKKGDHDNG